MILDLANPAHREALRRACKYAPPLRAGSTSPLDVALRALSSPSESAALVRALLEGCGVPCLGFVHGGPRSEWQVYDNCGDRIEVHGWLQPREPDVYRTLWPQHWPALILALLAATDRDGALAALREAGR